MRPNELDKGVLLADGAMGTYYAQLTGRTDVLPEFANKEDADRVEQIHREYMAAGARLIRTNTFSANTRSLCKERGEIAELVRLACDIGRRAIGQAEVFLAADIGPIPAGGGEEQDEDSGSVLSEYLFLADLFLEAGLFHFIFETFSSTEHLPTIAAHIKARRPDAFVLAQFATTSDGFTRTGIRIERIIREVKACSAIDAYGFNCGVGPAHLLHLLERMDCRGDIVSVMPNAGYPEIINERTVYLQNAAYFADRMGSLKDWGAKILGGCCGTTPQHIRSMAEKLGTRPLAGAPVVLQAAPSPVKTVGNSFADKLAAGAFVLAVELDPPFDADLTKVLHGAKVCRDIGVDLVTIADSPMARARMDSVMIAAKIKREIGIDSMPHICCRDKNRNALRSGLLAGYVEELRNVLAVTGDAVSDTDKADIKGVFNLHSLKLIELMAEMNQDVFAANPLYIGGALNLNVTNRDAEVVRMQRKAEKGAAFFLTQPLYSRESIDYLADMPRGQGSKILGGIMPLVSLKNAQFLNNEIPGIHIPEEYLCRFSPDMTREESEEEGIRIAVELARRIEKHVDGFYFITPFNRIGMIEKIVAAWKG